ncbi:phage portal protein family protein [Corynebacterium vitaeruminis]|uniref:phage portal protein family protein n=1 Tax=Corynebacterium vitaeruminis TaxID=38305 RepID=UPI0023F57C19|nr:hypothetical protein [Corynebacterium vitaeruminis]
MEVSIVGMWKNLVDGVSRILVPSGGELGYAYSTSLASRGREKLPELQWPRSQVTYTEMLRDAKVAQVELAITQPIERATWRISPNGAPDNIVQHIADDFRLPVHGQEEGFEQRRTLGRFNWSEHLTSVLRAPFLGVGFYEQVYYIGGDGREHLRKLAHRPNLSIQKIHIADDGGLVGITQKATGDREDVFIPVEHLVAYCYRPRDTMWTGSSLLRAAYPHWLAMVDFEALEYQIIHRNGMGIPVHTQSQYTPPEERAAERKAGLELARSLQAGTAAGATINPGADLKLLGVSGQLVSPREAIERHRDAIAQAQGADVVNLSGGGGSYALSSDKSDFLFQFLQTIAQWIADVTNQHVIEDLVRVAYPDYTGPVPLLTFTPIAAKKELAAGDLAQLANAGVLTKEPNLENWLRQNFDIPEARSLYEALQAKKDLQQAEQDVGVTLTGDPAGGAAQTDGTGGAG